MNDRAPSIAGHPSEDGHATARRLTGATRAISEILIRAPDDEEPNHETHQLAASRGSARNVFLAHRSNSAVSSWAISPSGVQGFMASPSFQT